MAFVTVGCKTDGGTLRPSIVSSQYPERSWGSTGAICGAPPRCAVAVVAQNPIRMIVAQKRDTSKIKFPRILAPSFLTHRSCALHRQNLNRFGQLKNRIFAWQRVPFVADIALVIQVGNGLGHKMVIQLLGFVGCVVTR